MRIITVKALAITLMLATVAATTVSLEVSNLDKRKIMQLLSAEEFKNRERLELLRMGERAKIVLRDIIRENKPPFYLVERTFIVLGEVFRDRASVDLIRPLLKHPNSDIRAGAARALRYIGDESDLPTLLQLLQDEETFVKFSAMEALSYIGSPKALPALRQAFAKFHPYSRPLVERAIRRIEIWNSPRRNEELQTAILSEDKELACWAVQKIAQLGLKEALPTLRKALESVRPAYGADRLRMEMEILSAIKKLGGTLSSEEIEKLEEFPPETLR